MAHRALGTNQDKALALAAFVAIAWLHVPFSVIVVGAGLLGYLAARHRSPRDDATAPPVARIAPDRGRTLRLLALWLPLWFAPLLLATWFASRSPVFTELGLFFSLMAVISVGGAYAVLSYVAQQAVERSGWITAGQMLDGLELAESTPGPLILVVQFVGFLAAYQAAGADSPVLAGLIGATIAVWVTFVPCFLWIFLGAPHVERIRGNERLTGGLDAVMAAVVGVIANLAVWFAMHVLFARQSARGLPELASVQWKPVVLTAIALLLMFALRRGLGLTLLACAVLGALGTYS